MSMRAEFGPGKYFLGDICYVLKDEIYNDVWGKKHKYEEGVFAVRDANLSSDESFAVAPTAWGDGKYFDDQNRSYCVDAGVIGIVPISMWKTTAGDIVERGLGTILDIKGKLVMNAEAGIFKIMADNEEILIDTKNEDEDDEDYDEGDD